VTHTATGEALRTSLYDNHLRLGGQMVEFGGWMMPLQYSSMREEHTAVRERVGLFDVSHMGEFRLRGPRAAEALEGVVTNSVGDLNIGQARYNVVCNPQGGIIDDTLVYRHGSADFTVVVNAGPRPKDLEHFRTFIGDACDVEDVTLATGLIAVQGPRALDLLRPIADVDLDTIGYYHFQDGHLDGVEAGFSRTGYTGEDGFELFVARDQAPVVWDRLLEAGAALGVLPCGLGARDTLRLEASMRLSGQDIDETTNPLEAGLGWAVKLDKGDFVGRDSLLTVKQEGIRRTFIGLELEGRAIARHGYAVSDGDLRVGEITSGTFSFTLGKAVAMGYIEIASKDSERLAVEVRGVPVAAHRTPLPFYKRQRS
jgi:aminomethyltransferase